MEIEYLISILEKRLKNPLPGKEAHFQMAPTPVDMRRFDPKLPENHRKSGVLILFYPEEGKAYFPLIKRPDYPGVHGGQIALPGGKMEELDEDLIQTALREAEEEIGVSRSQVRVIGQMSPLFIPTSNFLVNPVVGFVLEKPQMKPEEKEVQRIIETPVSRIFASEFRRRKILELGSGIKLDTPYFEIDGEMVWGATAMILSELIHLLAEE
ncbi:NUDIX domain-containing protein [Algoriphagus boseongensis]|uniref:NUDIX domain-containing protein n=1 Tax=Algoriphagus boseongensis TaxID=1442587 RepID=A0A4V3D2F7_9BACT|nr:CoA pyrophosphatase [Algoriphagus boseongensis]TDQ18757.1 NUDIX domain-containing protein [Algoriphagus boseongensis]